MCAMRTRIPKAFKPLSLPVMLAIHAQYVQEFLLRYAARRVGSRGHEQLSVDQSLMAIHLFLNFTKKPPWLADDEDWDRWGLDMAKRGLARTTVRAYQCAVVGFLEFCAASSLNDELEAKLKSRVKAFVTPDMLVRHSDDRRDGFERPCVRDEHFDAYVANLELLAIAHEHASRFGHAALVRRDLVLSIVIFRYGLRIAEALGINLDSFQRNPDAPHFGRFGSVSVLGKGHHASNKLPREVPTLDPDTPSILAEYLERTRPVLLKNKESKAFFLSARSTRLSAEEFRARFRSYWRAIGLGGERYTPHSLRHASVTHQLAMRRPLVFVANFHGHRHTSTTDRYSHFRSEFTREQVKRIIDAQLKRDDPTEPTQGD